MELLKELSVKKKRLNPGVFGERWHKKAWGRVKGRDMFKTTSKEDAFNISYLPSLSGIWGINELISTKFLETIK